jgi:hypothetical protein
MIAMAIIRMVTTVTMAEEIMQGIPVIDCMDVKQGLPMLP